MSLGFNTQQTSNGTHIYDDSLKQLEEWLVPCNAPPESDFNALSLQVTHQTKDELLRSGNDRAQGHIRRLVGYFLSTIIFQQESIRSPLAFRLPFLWKICQRATLLSFTSHEFHSSDQSYLV